MSNNTTTIEPTLAEQNFADFKHDPYMFTHSPDSDLVASSQGDPCGGKDGKVVFADGSTIRWDADNAWIEDTTTEPTLAKQNFEYFRSEPAMFVHSTGPDVVECYYGDPYGGEDGTVVFVDGSKIRWDANRVWIP